MKYIMINKVNQLQYILNKIVMNIKLKYQILENN